MNSVEKLYRDMISIITETRGRKCTSDFVGRVSYEGTELTASGINAVLSDMHEKGYLNVLSTNNGPDKIVLEVKEKGNYLMIVGLGEEANSSSRITTNFYGSVDRSNVATGNNNRQRQNNTITNDVDEIAAFLTPLLVKILEDANAPEGVKQQTTTVMEDLGEFKAGNILLDTFKDKVKEYFFGLLPSIASSAPSIEEAIKGIGSFING